MNAEIIAVGSELLLFGRHDGNGDWIASRLVPLGVAVVRRTIVGDDEREIAAAVESARARASLVLVTGGLGPTGDDLTREGLARALGTVLCTDAAIHERLVARIKARGYKVLESADRQARVPVGCLALTNDVGSAPGLLYEGPPCWIAAMPGVPGEMKAMFGSLLDRLEPILPKSPAPMHRFLVPGLPESEVDHRLQGLIGVHTHTTVTILASEGGVELLILGHSHDMAAARQDVDALVKEVRLRLGAAIASEGPDPLASAVGKRLLEARSTVAVAESCTGGLLGAALTSVAGSSSWFLGGFLTYSDDLKTRLLGVPAALIAENGAVSAPVARAMAAGARSQTGASHALAVTGIAGPDGGTVEKPVGLVHIALADDRGLQDLRLMLGGDRQAVRARSVTAALDLLRRRLDDGAAGARGSNS